jgi:Mitochondrial ATPase inhibitor, IATP
MWIREEEKAKLRQLKEKLTKQKEHIDKLSKDM